MALDAASLNFMIIDDDASVRDLIVQVLKGLGAMRITLADDGYHALELMGPSDPVPEIIFCDLRMPRMDGITLLRHFGGRRLVAGVVLVQDRDDPHLLETAELLARSYGLYVLGALEKPLLASDVAALIKRFDQDKTNVHHRQLVPITETELLAGLDGSALEIRYQLKVSTRERRVLGVEALARWNHPTRGLLGPAAFVPLAEVSGHMERLTDAVLRRSMSQAVGWKVDLDLAVNVSVEALHRSSFADDVPALAMRAGLDVARMILEITETRLMGYLTEPLEVAARLRLAGVRLSVDDLGTGYASLEQLQRIPFTELKIDRAFVHGAPSNPRARAILESSTALGHKLGLSICAEGAETREEWDLVSRCGCDEVQGYYLAMPMPADDISNWIEQWEAEPTTASF